MSRVFEAELGLLHAAGGVPESGVFMAARLNALGAHDARHP